MREERMGNFIITQGDAALSVPRLLPPLPHLETASFVGMDPSVGAACSPADGTVALAAHG